MNEVLFIGTVILITIAIQLACHHYFDKENRCLRRRLRAVIRERDETSTAYDQMLAANVRLKKFIDEHANSWDLYL